MGLRARLRDDNRCMDGNPAWGASVLLDTDHDCETGGVVGDVPTPPGGQPTGDADAYYSATILGRSRVGYDDDGVLIFDWVPLVSEPAVMKMKRRESDAVAGVSVETGTVTVAYSGPLNIFETATVRRDDGVLFRVTAVAQGAVALTLEVTRLDQQPDGVTW